MRNPSILAALLLTIFTVSVFAALHDYGPETAIRRFHDAATRRDFDKLAQLVQQPSPDQDLETLANSVYTLAKRGYSYEIGRVMRTPRRVIAQVIYRGPNNTNSLAQTWVVEKRQRTWEINTQATLDPNRIMLSR